MRMLLAIGLMALTVVPAFAQDEPRVLPTVRFGINHLPENYPQTTPQEALTSLLRAIDRDRVEYAIAHLLDVDFVADELKQIASAYPAELRATTLKALIETLRKIAIQTNSTDRFEELAAIYPDLKTLERRYNIEETPLMADAKLSLEGLRAFLFKQLIANVQRKMMDDPESVKTLRRLSREGLLKTTGDKATLTDKSNPLNVVHFRLITNRWFMENRRDRANAAKPAEPEAPADEK